MQFCSQSGYIWFKSPLDQVNSEGLPRRGCGGCAAGAQAGFAGLQVRAYAVQSACHVQSSRQRPRYSPRLSYFFLFFFSPLGFVPSVISAGLGWRRTHLLQLPSPWTRPPGQG